jgi:hypothetical protein
MPDEVGAFHSIVKTVSDYLGSSDHVNQATSAGGAAEGSQG